MHALRHAHELLVAGGTLVDLHPVTEEQVEAGGRRLGVIEEPNFRCADLPNAEARLRESIREGAFILEVEEAFDFLQHFDHADELIDAKAHHLNAQPALVRRIREGTGPLRLREHVVLRRLRRRP